jgi:putative phosphoribosyl transferase
VFRDRQDAGRRLARLLEPVRDERPVIYGLPRGGVPVAAEVARTLGAPLDVIAVRKVGAPQNPEFAIGAVAEDGIVVLSATTVRALGLSEARVAARIERARRELSAAAERWHSLRPPISPAGRVAVAVDDGLATGRSALAAVRSLRGRGAAHVILAVPVGAAPSTRALRAEADEVVCVEEPEELWAVGYWYERFGPTSEDELARMLGEAATAAPGSAADRHADAGVGAARTVTIPAGDGVELVGDLSGEVRPRGLVVFAHGSGSSRRSPRNRAVARALSDAGFATLLTDLLTAAEETDRGNVFDIGLLADRLEAASTWVRGHGELGVLPRGYFGASTGAAAALTAAARGRGSVAAVVSRGGRPDLAEGLAAVTAPTLLIVGGADTHVLELNRDAQAGLRCPSELVVIGGAGHLFAEPGALERVAQLAVEWFERHLVDPAAR